MSRRLLSFRWRTLTRRGFTIESAAGSRAERWKSISDFFAHPTVLVILGFALTGLLGRWLTDIADQNQRQREAIGKSMDDLRASMDDTSLAFQGYFERSEKLINLMEAQASPKAVASARSEYEAANYKWRERLAVDTPNIKQRYPSAPDDPVITILTLGMEFGSGWVDDCIDNGVLQALPQPVRGKQYQLVCTDIKTKSAITASDRLVSLGVCVGTLTSLMRPDPKDDFSSPSNGAMRKVVSQAAQKVCDMRRLSGSVDFLDKPR